MSKAEIETKKDNEKNERSPFLMCEDYDAYLESMSKTELLEYFHFVTGNYEHSLDKAALENIELQKQVDELKEENTNLKQGKAIMLDGITDLNRLVQFPVEYEGRNFEDIAELGNYIQEQAVKDIAKKIENNIQELLTMPFDGKTQKQEYQRQGMEEGLKMALEICNEATGIDTEQ